MKNIILSILVLFSLPLIAQVEDTPILVGKYFGSQSGGAAGYWQVSGNFTDESGYYDATSIAEGDVLFFTDAGKGYHLPIDTIISASGSSFVVRVLNSGITGVSAVPSGSGVIYRPTVDKRLFSDAAGITAADRQTYNNYLIEMLEAISAGVADGSVTWPKLATAVKDSIRFTKRDTTVLVNSDTYFADIEIADPARDFNNIYIIGKGFSDTARIAFFGAPAPYTEFKGVTYHVVADSGIVNVYVGPYGAASNSKSNYYLSRGQRAEIRALYDYNSETELWRVEVMWDSSGTVSGVYLPILGGSLTGTGGAGFIRFPTQSSNPSTPASGFSLFAGSTGAFTWKGSNGYARILDGLSNTADRTYTLQNSSGTLGMLEATQSWSGANSYTNSISISANLAGALGYNVTNTNSGTAAIAGLNMVNNGGNTFKVGITAQNYSGAVAGGHAGLIQSDGQNGVAIVATHGGGTVRLATGGDVERMRIHSSGKVTIGSSPSSEIATLGVICNEGGTFTPNGGIHITNTNGGGVASLVFNSDGGRVGDIAATGSSFSSGTYGIIQNNENWIVNRATGGLVGIGTEATDGYIVFATTGAGCASGRLEYDSERMRIGSDGNVSMGVIQGATLQSSAVLQLHSTTKGFRLPVMTDAEIAAISSPTLALQMFSTTDERINIKLTGGLYKLAYTTDIPTAKRDTTIYINDADYDFSAALTTTQIASRYNRVVFWMTTTAAASSDSEITLHAPDANLLQVEYLIHSVDEPAGFDNKIVFGTNNAVDSTNGLVTSYYPAAGDGTLVRAGLRSGVYKYRYNK